MEKNSIHSQITSGNPWFPSEYQLEDYEAGDQPSTKFPVMAPEGWKPERCEDCEGVLTGDNTKNFHYLAEAGYGDQKLCDSCLSELSNQDAFDRQREPSEGTNRGDWENRNYSSRQGSVHSQLTSNEDPVEPDFSTDDTLMGHDSSPYDPLLAAEEELANLMEQIEEVKLKIQMMEDKRGMESDADADYEAYHSWDHNPPAPAVNRQQLEQ